MNQKTKEDINYYINGIKRGDKFCLDSLYYAISPSVRHIALKYLKNQQDADDLVQDFWADIYKISLGFVFNKNGFSYLCKVMTNRALNRYKKLHNERCRKVEYVDYENFYSESAAPDKGSSLAAEENNLISASERKEQDQIIDKAIAQLPELERIIIQSIFFEYKTIRQIAKELNISKSLAGKLKQSAINKLKEKLGDFF